MQPVDFIEAGTGQKVVLLHSSVSGARQWRRLMSELESRFHTIAVNLLGYGRTPAWPADRPQTLDDQAALIDAVLSDDGSKVRLIGHSFGGSVAMKAAARLGDRVEKLVLLEPNPFYLLDLHGPTKAYAEIIALRDWVKHHSAGEDWQQASARFADYWGGAGTWASMADERRAAFIQALQPNLHEWDAVIDERTTLDEWARRLPRQTMVLSARDTVRPIHEIVKLMQLGCPAWHFAQTPEGGHMAPLGRPDLVNPIIASFLDEAWQPADVGTTE
ncbi:MAG: alpha/beta fold hydrolase [Geminicoccaceae bacterium]